MDYFSDEEDFVLTQESTRSFEQTQSASYGEDIVDNNCVVSLENQCEEGGEADFTSNVGDLNDAQHGAGCDNIHIEDISEDEAIDNM